MHTLPDHPHARTRDEVAHLLGTDATGLPEAEVERRRLHFGPNRLPSVGSVTWWQIALHQFQSPLIYLLMVAAVVAFLLHEYTDAAFIGIVLFLNALIGTIQEYGAERSAAALADMVPARSRVRRAGREATVEAADLVPGDLVLLEAGDRVPADLRLWSASALQIDESMLTGESVAVSKQVDAVIASDATVGDRLTMAFAGTLIARGRLRGLVTATGIHSELGRVSSSMREAATARPPLLDRMDRFAKLIAQVVLVTVLVVAMLGWMRSMELHDIFFACVALAVSAIPEGLPVGLTVALSIATRRMSRRNVIARRLVAVESLGSCTFIASDKTGTLTLNELTVIRMATRAGEDIPVEGVGLGPEGRVLLPSGREDALPEALRCLQAGVLTNDATHDAAPDAKGLWNHHGDAVDVALLVAAGKAEADAVEAWRTTWEETAALPFDPENQLSASLRVHSDGTTRVFIKGSPERLLARSDADAPSRAAWQQHAETWADEGFRVLALADAEVEADWRLTGVQDLPVWTLRGLVAMIDPLRPEAADAVARCREAGLEVAMVTGDHPRTALAISRQLGLARDASQVVTGGELAAAMAEGGPTAVQALVRDARVFARVEPTQKLEIVQALAALGHYVAVTGDGANDAPALKAAHVGVAMAARGTDVAREASSLIITDDHFASIVAGIEEGRIAYGNVRKVTFLLIATGATEVVLFLLSMVSNLPLPLLPVQLLWLNLVTNGIQDVALAFEPGEGDEMKQPPRDPQERIFDRLMIERVLLTAIPMGVLSWLVFGALLQAGWTEFDARNTLLAILVVFENILVGSARSEKNSLFRLSPLRNRVLLGGTLLALGLHVGSMQWSFMQGVLNVGPMDSWKWGLAISVALVPFFILELHKAFRARLAAHPEGVRRADPASGA
jgi:magnesium-transporting ATPase (P-type)